jgi:hypothetical protein
MPLRAFDRAHCRRLLTDYGRLLTAVGETVARKEMLTRELMLCTRHEYWVLLTSELRTAETVMQIRLESLRRIAHLLERALGPEPVRTA